MILSVDLDMAEERIKSLQWILNHKFTQDNSSLPMEELLLRCMLHCAKEEADHIVQVITGVKNES